MPIYEYQCEEHGVFEDRRNLSDRDNVFNCPVCGVSIKRIMSHTLVRMGEGEYNVPKDLDMEVGRQSSRAWEKIEERKNNR